MQTPTRHLLDEPKYRQEQKLSKSHGKHVIGFSYLKPENTRNSAMHWSFSAAQCVSI
jgi:hypothetical protein